MVRFPAIRGELQIVFGHDKTVKELSEAYEEAALMLEKLRGDPTADPRLLREYEKLCADIESDILGWCARR